MNEYLRKHNKKLLAIFGVFLMIAFLIPTFDRGGGAPAKGAFGTANGETITYDEYLEAQRDLRVLGQTRVQIDEFRGASLLDVNFGPVVARDLSEISYLLLLKEARRNHTIAPDEEVDLFVAQYPLYPQLTEPAAIEQRRAALRNVMSITNSFNRVAGAVRVSPALAGYMSGYPQQTMTLSLVEFPAERFLKDVPEPTDQQLQAFFDKHRNDDPSKSETGLGYRFPNRVRLQWVMIPLKGEGQKKGVLETITKEESAEYWLNNQDEFQTDPLNPETRPSTTQATTQATTRSATNPTTQAAAAPSSTRPATLASTRPTTRPWVAGNDVDKEIRRRLADERAATLARSVQQLMNGDYPAWREHARKNPAAATQPALSPASTLGVPYNSYSFMIRVAERIQASRESRGVLPETFDAGELLDADRLKRMYPIGRNERFRGYLYRFVEPFLTPEDRRFATDNRVPVAPVYEPIRLDPRIAADDAGNVYVVRVTEASPAHAAPDLASVRDQVARDWKNAQAMDRAREAAKKFADEARAKGTLAAAAQGNDALKVFLTERFSPTPPPPLMPEGMPTPPVPGYPTLPEEARAQFVKGATALLDEFIRTGKAKPVGVIDVPRGERVVVAQLQDAAGVLEPLLRLTGEPYRTGMMLSQWRQGELREKWYDANAINARVGYVPGKDERRGDGQQPAPAENAPRRGPLQGL